MGKGSIRAYASGDVTMFQPSAKLCESLHRLRPFLLIMAGSYLLSGTLGSLLVSLQINPFIFSRIPTFEVLAGARPIVDILGKLRAGHVAQAVGYTFAWNFGVAALLTSTAAGVVFFLPPIIGAWRGFLVGVLFHGQWGSLPVATLFLGTFLLEIGAYVIAGAAGMGFGFALLPRRSGDGIRRRAGRALQDILTVYPLVAGMLFCGAVWEILGIYSLSRLVG
ncbi:MAG: stage II sporulation protein M [Candidatus Methylomirabilales bacterium]